MWFVLAGVAVAAFVLLRKEAPPKRLVLPAAHPGGQEVEVDTLLRQADDIETHERGHTGAFKIFAISGGKPPILVKDFSSYEDAKANWNPRVPNATALYLWDGNTNQVIGIKHSSVGNPPVIINVILPPTLAQDHQ